MFHVTVFLFFILVASSKAFSLNLCALHNELSTNLTSYNYADKQTQNCNCTLNIPLCIRKCCAVGFYATHGGCKKRVDSSFIIPIYNGKKILRNVNGNTGVLVGTMNCTFFALFNEIDDWFYVQENGTILTSLYGTLTNDDYCVDFIDDRLGALIGYSDSEGAEYELQRRLSSIGMIISIPFLLATFIVYALLPHRNLHMKALMFYVINLMVSFIILVVIQLKETGFTYEVCKTLGYSCLFFLLVSFFWMNVICVDTWFALSNKESLSEDKKKAERQRFIFYCTYAWCIPVLLILSMYIVDNFAASDSELRPGIGEERCFLRQGYPELVYFYDPITLLIAINIILYIIIAFKIRNIKKKLCKNGKQKYIDRFNSYIKLLFAMGVNWSMEIISWAVFWVTKKPHWIWYLTDFCNAMYGVFIFFIFVFKRHIWKLLKKQYNLFMISKSPGVRSTSNTDITNITSDPTDTSR